MCRFPLARADETVCPAEHSTWIEGTDLAPVLGVALAVLVRGHVHVGRLLLGFVLAELTSAAPDRFR